MNQMEMEMKMAMWISTKYHMPEYKIPLYQDVSLEVLKQANLKVMGCV